MQDFYKRLLNVLALILQGLLEIISCDSNFSPFHSPSLQWGLDDYSGAPRARAEPNS